MTSKDFQALSDFILLKNPYFQHGFGLAVKEVEEDVIRIGEQTLFPNDRLGNYFFMLSDGRFTINDKKKLSDCGPVKLSANNSLTVKVLAIVDGVDEWALANNLLNSLTVYNGLFTVSPTRATVNRAIVTREVISGFSKDTQYRLLSRWKNEAVVSVEANIYKPVMLDGCIVDLCKDC